MYVLDEASVPITGPCSIVILDEIELNERFRHNYVAATGNDALLLVGGVMSTSMLTY